MVHYGVLVSEEVTNFLKNLDPKSLRIYKANLSKLGENPYPGEGRGDKERIVYGRKEAYRLHVGRSCTAFYRIYEEECVVKVIEMLAIREAHRKYGG